MITILWAWLILMGHPVTAAGAEAAAKAEVGQHGETDADEPKPEEKRFRLLPIPLIITEPAIGEGLGLTLALFHPVKQGKTATAHVATPGSIAGVPDTREAPPVVTAAVAAYTNNDTWFAGLGHINNWRNDALRYAGAVAMAQVNSRIYLLNLPVGFRMDADILFQELKFRLGSSDIMFGAGFVYLDAHNRFGPELPDRPEDDRFALNVRDVALSTKLAYESRDNAMNPTSGRLIELGLSRHDKAIGGSFDYWTWDIKALSFHPLAERITLGLRLALSGVDGRPPFFAYPYVNLRGVPALRYQNRVAGAAEVEGRYLLAPRWEVSAFCGLGYTSSDVPLFENPDSIYNLGVGGRYKVFDAHNVWMGIDLARGPEDWNGYVKIGQAW